MVLSVHPKNPCILLSGGYTNHAQSWPYVDGSWQVVNSLIDCVVNSYYESMIQFAEKVDQSKGPYWALKYSHKFRSETYWWHLLPVILQTVVNAGD